MPAFRTSRIWSLWAGALALFATTVRAEPPHAYPAEWEPHDVVWLGFRSHEINYDSVTIPMLRALTRHVDVRLVVEDETLIPDGVDFLAAEGVDVSRIELFVQSPTDVWFRDPGPIFLRRQNGTLSVADFQYSNYANVRPEFYSPKALAHETIDKDVAQRLDLPTVPSRVAMEGGSIEVNGRGTLIVSELTRRRNPHLTVEEIEADLKRTLGQRHVIWLKEGLAEDAQTLQPIVGNYYGLGTGGHTDEFVRFANERTVLLAWVDEDERDRHPINAINYERMSENLQILSRAKDQDGRPLNIVRVPLPEIQHQDFQISRQEIDLFRRIDPYLQVGDQLRLVWPASYLNFVVTNGLVLIPKFWREGRPEIQKTKDAEALALFESLFPDREIVQIDPLALNQRGGGMHCVILQQPRTGK